MKKTVFLYLLCLLPIVSYTQNTESIGFISANFGGSFTIERQYNTSYNYHYFGNGKIFTPFEVGMQVKKHFGFCGRYSFGSYYNNVQPYINHLKYELAKDAQINMQEVEFKSITKRWRYRQLSLGFYKNYTFNKINADIGLYLNMGNFTSPAVKITSQIHDNDPIFTDKYANVLITKAERLSSFGINPFVGLRYSVTHKTFVMLRSEIVFVMLNGSTGSDNFLNISAGIGFNLYR